MCVKVVIGCVAGFLLGVVVMVTIMLVTRDSASKSVSVSSQTKTNTYTTTTTPMEPELPIKGSSIKIFDLDFRGNTFFLVCILFFSIACLTLQCAVIGQNPITWVICCETSFLTTVLSCQMLRYAPLHVFTGQSLISITISSRRRAVFCG